MRSIDLSSSDVFANQQLTKQYYLTMQSQRHGPRLETPRIERLRVC